MAAVRTAIPLRKAAFLPQRRRVRARTEKAAAKPAHPTEYGALVYVGHRKAAHPTPQSLALVPMGKMDNAHAAVPVFGGLVHVHRVVRLGLRSLACVVAEKVGRRPAKWAVSGERALVKAQAFALRGPHRLAHAPREPLGRKLVIPKGRRGWSASALPQKNPPSHGSRPKKG